MAFFRIHCGTLEESLDISVPVESIVDVRVEVEKHFNELGISSYGLPMHIDFYGYDNRIQKDLFVVRLKHYGVLGWIELEPMSRGEISI